MRSWSSEVWNALKARSVKIIKLVELTINFSIQYQSICGEKKYYSTPVTYYLSNVNYTWNGKTYSAHVLEFPKFTNYFPSIDKQVMETARSSLVIDKSVIKDLLNTWRNKGNTLFDSEDWSNDYFTFTKELVGFGDGETTSFYVKFKPIDSSQSVEVYQDDSLVSPSDYTIDYSEGKITFSSAPSAKTRIEVTYSQNLTNFSETFTGTGNRRYFYLDWTNVKNVSVTLNGSSVSPTVHEKWGCIEFDTAPEDGDEIVVNYDLRVKPKILIEKAYVVVRYILNDSTELFTKSWYVNDIQEGLTEVIFNLVDPSFKLDNLYAFNEKIGDYLDDIDDSVKDAFIPFMILTQIQSEDWSTNYKLVKGFPINTDVSGDGKVVRYLLGISKHYGSISFLPNACIIDGYDYGLGYFWFFHYDSPIHMDRTTGDNAILVKKKYFKLSFSDEPLMITYFDLSTDTTWVGPDGVTRQFPIWLGGLQDIYLKVPFGLKMDELLNYLFGFKLGININDSSDSITSTSKSDYTDFVNHGYAIHDLAPYLGISSHYYRFILTALIREPIDIRTAITNLLYSTCSTVISLGDELDGRPLIFWNPYNNLDQASVVDTVDDSKVIVKNEVPQLTIDWYYGGERRPKVTVEYEPRSLFYDLKINDKDPDTVKSEDYYYEDQLPVAQSFGYTEDKESINFKSLYIGDSRTALFVAKWWSLWQGTHTVTITLQVGAWGLGYYPGDLVNVNLTLGDVSFSGTCLILSVRELDNYAVELTMRNIDTDLFKKVFSYPISERRTNWEDYK